MVQGISAEGFPGGAAVKDPPAKAGDAGDLGSVPGWGKISWRRKRPEELDGYSPRGCKESNTTEHAHACTHVH